MLIAPREMPLSPIASREYVENSLDLMWWYLPLFLATTQTLKSLDDMERFIIGKWYDSLGIEHSLYRRWGE